MCLIELAPTQPARQDRQARLWLAAVPGTVRRDEEVRMPYFFPLSSPLSSDSLLGVAPSLPTTSHSPLFRSAMCW